MPENDKRGAEEENFSLHCVQNGQEDGRNKYEMFHAENTCWVQQ